MSEKSGSGTPTRRANPLQVLRLCLLSLVLRFTSIPTVFTGHGFRQITLKLVEISLAGRAGYLPGD